MADDFEVMVMWSRCYKKPSPVKKKSRDEQTTPNPKLKSKFKSLKLEGIRQESIDVVFGRFRNFFSKDYRVSNK